MASLMEDFIDTLRKEHAEYEVLLEMSKKKTPIIVKGDTDALSKITEEESAVVDRITHLDKHRVEVLTDIASVLNKDVNTLTVPDLIALLARQPKEQGQLREVYDLLKVTLTEMKRVNEQNGKLIELSLEMVQFDMNLIQAAKSGPETGDYNRLGGYQTGGAFGGGRGGFDAKQ